VGVFVVSNPHGLHARPAARLVAEVRGLDAAVELRNLTTGGAPVPAGSLSRVATLGALKGHQVEIRAGGARASEAVEQLLALAARHFDESVAEPDVAQQAAAAATTARGPLPASAGIAVGPVRHLGAASIELPSESDEAALGGPAQQWQRVEQAVADARRQIEQVRSRTAREVGDAEASIFDAHLSLLSTPRSSPRCGAGSTAVRERPLHGPQRWWTSSSSGRACPTPTCASGPLTSVPSAPRCCGPSPVRAPSRRWRPACWSPATSRPPKRPAWTPPSPPESFSRKEVRRRMRSSWRGRAASRWWSRPASRCST
jgi:phosphotransferase system HPr (HPr) family protein